MRARNFGSASISARPSSSCGDPEDALRPLSASTTVRARSRLVRIATWEFMTESTPRVAPGVDVESASSMALRLSTYRTSNLAWDS